MRNLLKDCPECRGYGYVTIDINDTMIPYEQNEIDYTCMCCDGKGYIVLEEDLAFYIDDIEYMISGMQTRIIMITDWIKGAKKYNNEYLVKRYLNRLENCSNGLARLEQYKRKLLNLA